MRRKFDPSNLVMVYLLGVALIAARVGSGPAVLCSILSVVAFDFFFIKLYSFGVAHIQHLVTLGVMLAVALLISRLTSQLHVQAQDAGERERRTAALYSMSGQLASNWGTAKLLDVIVRHVAEILQSEVAALMPDEAGRLVIRAGNEAAFPMNARERGVAHWVFDVGRAAGMGTNTMPGAECLYVPLNGTRGSVGVLAVRPLHAGRALTPDLLQLLEAFATQAGMAVESDRYADEARKAQLEVEVEKSRNALLNSVSHDLRTPLSAITGAASTLLEPDDRLPAAARRELAEMISEEAAHLSRLVTNLLEMTRLESGAAKVKKEPCPIEEVLGSALTRLEKQLSGHPVVTHIPADLPLVPLDVILTEHVFINLLENAAKYTPAGSTIEVSATASDREVTVEIADRGPGISPGDEKKIFEKFYRGKLAGSASGVGLGLTICRAVVEAHGGKIWAENRPGGGAAFRFTLPLAAG
jgi:two-component system sensor histidine kinase KdpD